MVLFELLGEEKGSAFDGCFSALGLLSSPSD